MDDLSLVLLNQNVLGRGDGGWRFTKYSKVYYSSLLNTSDLEHSIVILCDSGGKREGADHVCVSWGGGGVCGEGGNKEMICLLSNLLFFIFYFLFI